MILSFLFPVVFRQGLPLDSSGHGDLCWAISRCGYSVWLAQQEEREDVRFNGVVNLPFFALVQSFWVEERYQILSISPKPPHSLGWGWSALHLMAVPLWPCISACTSSFPAYSFSSNRSTNHSPHWYLLGALKFCGENTIVMWKWFQDDRCYLCAFFGSFSPKRSQT